MSRRMDFHPPFFVPDTELSLRVIKKSLADSDT